MTKEELKQEAEKWLRKFLLCNDCKRKCHCIELNAYCEEQVLKAYIDSAEPREKRIAELEQKLEQTEKDLADYQFNYPTIKELQKENAELKAQIENDRDLPAIAYIQGAESYKRKADKQLTKAKEIIREFMKYEINEYDGSLEIHFEELKKQAEQFLKE